MKTQPFHFEVIKKVAVGLTSVCIDRRNGHRHVSEIASLRINFVHPSRSDGRGAIGFYRAGLVQSGRTMTKASRVRDIFFHAVNITSDRLHDRNKCSVIHMQIRRHKL